jgi:hypothetical protein
VGKLFLYPYAQATMVRDDNVLLNSRNQKSDVYTIFTPGAMLVYGSPRGNYCYLDYSADFSTLDEGDSDAFDGQSMTAGLRQQGARTQVGLSHQYREVRDVDTEIGARLKRKTNTIRADIDTRVLAKTSVGVLGSYSVSRFEDDLYSDNREYSGGGRVSWQMRPKVAVFGQASHGWVDVDQSRDAFGSAQYDEASVGVSGKPRPTMGAMGSVGVQHRYFEDDSIEDVTRNTFNLTLTGSPLERFGMTLGLSAGLHPAVNAPGYTVYDTRIEPGISRHLFSERVVGSLSGQWGRSQYLGSSGASEDEGTDSRVYDGREDNYWGIGANVDWWIGHYWSVGVGYSYMENNSSADDRPVDEQSADPSSYDVGRWMIRASFNK